MMESFTTQPAIESAEEASFPIEKLARATQSVNVECCFALFQPLICLGNSGLVASVIIPARINDLAPFLNCDYPALRCQQPCVQQGSFHRNYPETEFGPPEKDRRERHFFEPGESALETDDGEKGLRPRAGIEFKHEAGVWTRPTGTTTLESQANKMHYEAAINQKHERSRRSPNRRDSPSRVSSLDQPKLPQS